MAAQQAPIAPAVRLTRQDESQVHAVMNELRHTQPWSYYSTIRLPDFQNSLRSQVLAFWQETEGSAQLAVTNIPQIGQIPEAFQIQEIGVRIAISVYDDPRIFELLTNYSAIRMIVGTDEMITGPTTQFPSGGGVTGMVEAHHDGPASIGSTGGGGGGGAPGRGGGTAKTAAADQTSQQQAPPSTAMHCAPIFATLPYKPALNVLTNGVAHRTNVFQLGRDPIDVKKGSNIKTEFHIDQAALAELKGLGSPMAPGVTIQLRLIGKRARAAGYGMGG